MRKKRLDDKTINDVVGRYSRGESITALMAEIGLSQSAFSKAIKRRGITLDPRKPAITAKMIREAMRLYEEGLSQDQIARQLGVKRTTLAQHLRAEGYQARDRYETLRKRSKLKSSEVKRYHNRYLRGESIASLASEAGLSKVSLTNTFHRHNLQVRAWSRMTPTLARAVGLRLKNGETLPAISKELGFSPSGLRQALARHGVAPPQIDAGALEEIRVRHEAGIPLDTLASELGLSIEGLGAILEREQAKARASRRPKHPRKAAGASTDRSRKLADEQIREIHRRRIAEKIGIWTLAKEYGVNPSSLYERMRKLGLAVSSGMGTKRKVFSHDFVQEIYAEARRTKKSVIQVLRERGLAERAGGISISGRALGLVPLSPSEITGHSERDTYLYIMKVTIPGKTVGLYAGQSIDPLMRMRQHIVQATKGITTRNKRTAFIREAIREARSVGIPIAEIVTIEILPGVIAANAAGDAERDLITRIRDQCSREGHVFLNGLIGAPAGGYGRVIGVDIEAEIVRAYSSGKTSQEVAYAFGVSRSTVNRIIAARGKQKSPAEYLRRYDDTITDQAISLAKAGHKQDAICEQLGISKPTLYKVLRKAGLTKAHKPRPR